MGGLRTHCIVHFKSCDNSFVGFYERPDHVLVFYELRIRTNGVRRWVIGRVSWTDLNVPNDRFSLLLDLGEAFLHSFTLL